MIIDRNHPFSHLNNYVYKTINERSFCGRLWQTIKMVKDQNGYIAATAATFGMVASTIYTFTFSYFCAEGTVRSFIEVDESLKQKGHLSQSIGDAGGWLSLPIFFIFGLISGLRRCAREGEFSKIKEISHGWYVSVTSDTIPLENRFCIPIDDFYSNINNLIDQIASQCLFYKSLTNRILITTKIVEEIDATDLEAPIDLLSDLSLDLQLKSIYEEIEKEKAALTSSWNYFRRLRAGLNMTEVMHGKKSRTWSITTGIVCPVMLAFGALCSAIGEPILGKKVLGEKEDVVEVGHFGEWPDNLVEAAVVSFSLNRDLVLKGDVFLLFGIYKKHLDSLDPIQSPKGNKELHNRLCEVANDEIQQIMSSCFSLSSLTLNFFHPI